MFAYLPLLLVGHLGKPLVFATSSIAAGSHFCRRGARNSFITWQWQVALLGPCCVTSRKSEDEVTNVDIHVGTLAYLDIMVTSCE